MKKKNRRKVVLSLLAVSVVAVGIIVAYSLLSGGPASVALAQEVAQTGNIASYYHFSGNVVVKDSESITAKGAATVRDVYISEGSHVDKGERLIRLSDGTVIKAGISGEITKLSVEEDDDIQANAPLVDIVNFDDLEIEIKVDEFDVPAISVGETVQVTINALNKQYESQIIRFNKQATVSGDVSYYAATLSTGGMESILPGMQVEVKALNQFAQNVTVISMSALKFHADNTPYVTVMDPSGETRDANVTVGANDGLYVEIVSGLRSGETVALQQSKVITPGAGAPFGQ